MATRTLRPRKSTKPRQPSRPAWAWIHRVIDTTTETQVNDDYIQFEFAVCAVCDLGVTGRYRIESTQEKI